MNNDSRPDKRHIFSSENGDPAKPSKHDPEGSQGATSGINPLRDERVAEPVSSKPSNEFESGFTPKIDLVANRDKPSVRAPIRQRKREARSDLALLPYEAAQLAGTMPPLKQPQQLRFDGKLIPLCLVGIVMAASVVSGAVVWSVHDDGAVSPAAEVSATGSIISIGNRKRLPHTNPSTSERVGVQNHAALASVQKNESDGVKDRTEAGSALRDLPATLVAAASPGSMVNRRASTAQPPTLTAEDREAIGVVPRQIKFGSDADIAHLVNNPVARPQHKPSLKPLEVAGLLPPAVVTTSFRPAFKPRETSFLNPPKSGQSASSDTVDDVKHVPMLERLWGGLVQGVAEAYRNRDTSYQLVLKADSRGGGSDEHRGGGNHGGGNDYDNHDG